MNLDIELFLKTMEEKWQPKEEEFKMTDVFCYLEKTCPEHKVGQKDLTLMCFKCPVCQRILDKFQVTKGLV